MSRFYGSRTLLDRFDVAALETVITPVLDISGFADVLFTWSLRVAGGEGTFEVFGSPLGLDDPRLHPASPALNNFWVSFGSIITAADGVLTGGSGNIGDNVIRSVLVQYNCTVATDGLSLIAGFAERT